MLNTIDKLPGIIYSLIARNTVVLVEYSTHEGNFSALAKRILLSIKAHDHKRTYSDKSGRFVFHYMVLDNLTYLCFATKGHKKAVCFSYLNEIYSRFVVAYTEKQILQAISYTKTFVEFQSVLEREMKRYSRLETIPEPPKFSTPYNNDNTTNTNPLSSSSENLHYDTQQSFINSNNNISNNHYVELDDLNSSSSGDRRSIRSSTISLLMQENDAIVEGDRLHRKKLIHSSSFSEPLLVKNDITYSEKKLRSRCFYFFLFFIFLIIFIWLISSITCGFDFGICRGNRNRN